jgi:hypothetical protein
MIQVKVESVRSDMRPDECCTFIEKDGQILISQVHSDYSEAVKAARKLRAALGLSKPFRITGTTDDGETFDIGPIDGIDAWDALNQASLPKKLVVRLNVVQQ